MAVHNLLPMLICLKMKVKAKIIFFLNDTLDKYYFHKKIIYSVIISDNDNDFLLQLWHHLGESVYKRSRYNATELGTKRPTR